MRSAWRDLYGSSSNRAIDEQLERVGPFVVEERVDLLGRRRQPVTSR
jgi:hypothetical protein